MVFLSCPNISMADFEITIIGAGVVGLAIGARLSKNHPHLVVLEKSKKYGMETSSRSSEVIHGTHGSRGPTP